MTTALATNFNPSLSGMSVDSICNGIGTVTSVVGAHATTTVGGTDALPLVAVTTLGHMLAAAVA